MMGSQGAAQGALFYEFSLEEHVPADHVLRSVDRFVDLSDLRRHLAPFYSAIGRPSVDPELMVRMLLVGYIMGIRSERRLCAKVHLNLAYRWFCRLDLTDPIPDHSTFSKNRHGRFRDSDLFRRLFENVVARCIAEGLVGGDGFGVDASLIKADASRYTKVEAADWSAPETVTRATQEYLDTLDDAAFGGATPVKPKTLSPADPAARFTGANGDRAFFACNTNYLVDLENAAIVDVEATAPIRQAEAGAAQTMIRRVRERFGLFPELLAADTAYGAAEMLGWLVEDEGIEPLRHAGVHPVRSRQGLRGPRPAPRAAHRRRPLDHSGRLKKDTDTMTDLGATFDATQVEPTGEFEQLPAGEYEAQVIESRREPVSRDRPEKGDCLSLTWKITTGRSRGGCSGSGSFSGSPEPRRRPARPPRSPSSSFPRSAMRRGRWRSRTRSSCTTVPAWCGMGRRRATRSTTRSRA